MTDVPLRWGKTPTKTKPHYFYANGLWWYVANDGAMPRVVGTGLQERRPEARLRRLTPFGSDL